MFNKVERYVNSMLKNAREHAHSPAEVITFRSVAFGAVQFAIDAGLINFDEVWMWWDKIHLEFSKIADSKGV